MTETEKAVRNWSAAVFIIFALRLLAVVIVLGYVAPGMTLGEYALVLIGAHMAMPAIKEYVGPSPLQRG